MNSNLLGPLITVIGTFSLAVSLLIARRTMVEGRSFDVVLTSIWINALIFIPSLLMIHGTNFEFTRISILAFTLSGISGTVLGRVCFYASTKRIGASLTAPITQSNLLVATIFSVLIIGEVITRGHFIGILILLTGIIFISHEIEGNNREKGFRLNSDLLILSAVIIFFGLSTPLFKIGLSEGSSVLSGLALKSIIALTAVTSFSLLKGFSPLRPFTGAHKRIYLYIGLCQTIGYLLIFSALSFSRVVVVAPFLNMEPFFILILSYLFLGHLEMINKSIIIGSFLVISGGAIISVFM